MKTAIKIQDDEHVRPHITHMKKQITLSRRGRTQTFYSQPQHSSWNWVIGQLVRMGDGGTPWTVTGICQDVEDEDVQ